CPASTVPTRSSASRLHPSFSAYGWASYRQRAPPQRPSRAHPLPGGSPSVGSLFVSPLRWLLLLGRSKNRPPSHRPFVAPLLGLRSPQLPLPEPVEDDWCHDEDKTERAHHAAEDRCRQRLHDLRAGGLAPHDGQQARDDRRDCHDLRPQPQERAFLHGVQERLARESTAELLALVGDGLFEVN